MEMAILEIKMSFQTLPHSEFSTWSEWHTPLPPSSLNYYVTLTVSQKAKFFGPVNHLLKSTTERYPTSCCLKSLGVVFLTFQEVYLTEFAYGKAASGFLCQSCTWAQASVWNVEREESWSLRTGGPWEVMTPWPFSPLKTHFHHFARATHSALASPSSLQSAMRLWFKNVHCTWYSLKRAGCYDVRQKLSRPRPILPFKLTFHRHRIFNVFIKTNNNFKG